MLQEVSSYQNRLKNKLSLFKVKQIRLESKVLQLKSESGYKITTNNYEQAKTTYYNAIRLLQFKKTEMPMNDYNSLKKWHYTQFQAAETEYNAWKAKHTLLYDLIEELEVLEIGREIISVDVNNLEQERMYLIRADRTLEEIGPLIPEDNLVINE